MKYIFGLCLLVSVFSCKNKSSADKNLKLGEITMEVTAKEEAKQSFHEGMLLLHSFEFEDAEEKFLNAQEIDPEFAMAYWGQAMCQNHPLWREQDFNKAVEILAKLGETKEERREKFKTDFEKDMFDAISVLYGKGSKRQRDEAYSEYMSVLSDKYPDNNEVTAFHALSVLGAVKGGRDFEAYAKGARIAKSILEENPNHPGALHYLIHSYDDPQNAHKALEAANSYSQVAPDAGHALHMPSHIYVALGMWDEVISSNINSWNASKKRKEAKGLDNDALNYHGFKWLMYAYLQKGDLDNARRLVKEMQDYCYEYSTQRSVSHLVMMKAAYFIESNNWNDSLVYDTIDYSKHSFYTKNAHHYLMGMKAFADNDVSSLQKKTLAMDTLYKRHTQEAMISDAPLCSGSYNRYSVTELDLQRSKVMKLELEALKLILKGDAENTESLMVEAVELERNTSYNYGPPEIVKPSNELYAEWLISQERYEEAEKQLQSVLERAPGRYIVMNHLAKMKNNS